MFPNYGDNYYYIIDGRGMEVYNVDVPLRNYRILSIKAPKFAESHKICLASNTTS